MKVAKGLKVKIEPTGWLGRPYLRVLFDSYPVLNARVLEGEVNGWLSVWGLYGNCPERQIDGAFICELMGWTNEKA